MKSHRFPHLIDDSRLDSYSIILEKIQKQGLDEFDLKATSLMAPAGAAILSCLTDAVLERGKSVHFVIGKEYEMPFIAHLDSLVKKSGHLPAPSAYNFETDELILAGCQGLDLSFFDKFEAKFALGEDLLFDCRMILQELVQNAMAHSGAERYFIYAGLWNEEMHCGVLDMGVSVPAKLRQKYSFDDDVSALLLALREGTTTRRERAGGLGLYYFYDILKRNRAKLTFASGGGQVRFYFKTRRSQKSRLKYFLPGTWCFARIPLRGNVS